MTSDSEEAAVLAAARGDDEAAFALLAERYRRQLHVHCYRLLGSVEDAEDLVQETLLRAWRGRASFERRSLFRTWLYRIATNACLNALTRTPRRVLPSDVVPPAVFDPVTDSGPAAKSDPRAQPTPATEIPWLRPYPDRLLEPLAAGELEPERVIVARETIELAYMAALQHLPPQQRAVLILRDALDFSARDTAAVLDTSVPAVNSALQRARSTMRTRLPGGRHDWVPAADPSGLEQLALERFVDAWERADLAALLALFREDARWAMPPAALWFDGRDAIAGLYRLFPMGFHGVFRMLRTTANRQPAAAAYLRPHGQSEYQLVALHVLRVEGGQIAEVTTFAPELCAGLGLPPTL